MSLSRDYNCTRCGATVNGIPYGPIFVEWCLDCALERAEIDRLEKATFDHLDGSVILPDSAVGVARALSRRAAYCEREARDLREQAECYEKETESITDALKDFPRRYLPFRSRQQLRLDFTGAAL